MSKYHRKKALEIFKELGVDVDKLEKGKPILCWGEDLYLAGY